MKLDRKIAETISSLAEKRKKEEKFNL